MCPTEIDSRVNAEGSEYHFRQVRRPPSPAREKREPNWSLAEVLPCMRVLGKLEKMIDPQRRAHA